LSADIAATVMTGIIGTTATGTKTGIIGTIDTAIDSALARSVLESPC
jgi:hypothetical protein